MLDERPTYCSNRKCPLNCEWHNRNAPFDVLIYIDRSLDKLKNNETCKNYMGVT